MDVAVQMEKMALGYIEERRKLEAVEGGRRAKEGLTIATAATPATNNNSAASVKSSKK